MRKAFAAIITVGLLSSHVALADSCTRPADKVAFDITGLKSQLMVTALTCGVDEKYNSFVARFRTHLVQANTALTNYFTRAFGRSWQEHYDDYITSLANSQSQNGLKLGVDFCKNSLGMFDEVMSLPSDKELDGFAGAKEIVQPVSFVECPPPAAPQPRVRQASVAPAH